MPPTITDELFEHIKERNIIPRVQNRDPRFDLSNIQGDVFPLFPKEVENFIFFTIKDAKVAEFKRFLKDFRSTTSHDVLNHLGEICEKKKNATGIKWDRVGLVQTQIAFSRSGLDLLGKKDPIQDRLFDKGSMRKDKEDLGSTGDWDNVFDGGKIHGVVIVAANFPGDCDARTTSIRTAFEQAVKRSVVVRGKVRPDPHTEKEHFGYRDGISEPALRGLVKPHKGQIEVDPGVIIMGYPGDPVIDNQGPVQRPAWTKDGTIMVFQKLEQDVPEFDRYLAMNGPRWPEFIPKGETAQLTKEEGAELFGAQLMGRWKSGAPLARTWVRDDPEMAKNMEENNNFDYSVQGETGLSNRRCPFTAHTRKTVPRNLDPYIGKKFLESAVIMRAGIPYGSELTDRERRENKSLEKRGLLFVCYQSCLDNGFARVATGFGANDYFPVTSVIPTKHGQDPIIGGPPEVVDVLLKEQRTNPVAPNSHLTLRFRGRGGEVVEVSGSAKIIKPSSKSFTEDFFVTSRGGEYFFVPSISTLNEFVN